jgi:ribosomal-protein-serine acetyltransferase
MKSLPPIPVFSALRSGELTLRLLNDDNVPAVLSELRGLPDEEEMSEEILTNYLPAYWHDRRINFGFAAYLRGELAGFSLLSIEDWHELKASTGADTLLHMRGRGVAPGSKPHLFFLAFQLLGLHRVETGHRVSNVASQRSIQKTPGFVLEGRSRESGRNEDGKFEDELLYGILRREWQDLYNPAVVEVLP